MTRPDSPAEREALASDHARAWMEAYGIRTAPYTRGGSDHPMMHTLPVAFLAFADALRSRRPSEEEVARVANLIGEHVYAMDGHRTIAGLTEAARAVLAYRAAALVTEAGDG